MRDLFLFEAGSTKTDVVYLIDGERKESSLPGFNPNRESTEFLDAFNSFESITKNAIVFFYGSGLGSDENKNVVRELFGFLNSGQIQIYDDILGGARAAFNNSPGIVCIMGTGGLAAYYDGKNIVKRRGGYGYLIDDLGGGFELGKRIIASWLNDDLSEDCIKALQASVNMDKRAFLKEIYQTKNLKLIASISKSLADLKDESLQKVVDHYLEDFFTYNVLPLTKEFNLDNFSIIGSIGTGYYKSIRKQSDRQGLQLDQCIQSPAQRLFDYHNQKGKPI